MPGAAERILSLAENDQKIQKDFLIEEQNRKELLVKNSHSENMAQIKIGKAFIFSLLAFSFILLVSGLYMIIFKEDKMVRQKDVIKDIPDIKVGDHVIYCEAITDFL